MKYLKEYNNTNLRSAQLVMLSILTEIDRICAKHYIEYWLDGGTLLGAVRHSRFIPWDDDVDIAMRKEEYEKFIKIAPQELKEEFFLQTPESDPNYKTPLAKVRCRNSLIIESGENTKAQYERGLYVDIFPFVDYPTLPKRLLHILSRGICVSHSVLHYKLHTYSIKSFLEFFYFIAKYACFIPIWKILSLFKKDGIYMSNILIHNGYGIVHKKKDILPTSKILFEGKIFSAPHNPDSYLRDLYGDYNILPPEEKRVSHNLLIIPELVLSQTKDEKI